MVSDTVFLFSLSLLFSMRAHRIACNVNLYTKMDPKLDSIPFISFFQTDRELEIIFFFFKFRSKNIVSLRCYLISIQGWLKMLDVVCIIELRTADITA